MYAVERELLAPGLIERGLRRLGVDVATHDPRAVTGEHQSATLADTAAGAGDDCNFALKALR
jgi:hypothetical protein